MKTTTLQIELNHYILGHGFDAMPQDSGVAFLLPVTLASAVGAGMGNGTQ